MMLAALMTGPHFAISALMKRRTPAASSPPLRGRVFQLLTHLRFAHHLDGVGVHFLHDRGRRLGRREQPVPRRHVEARHAGLGDGRQIPGSAEKRLPELTASARSRPACTCGISEPEVLNIMVSRPGMRSMIAGAAPR